LNIGQILSTTPRRVLGVLLLTALLLTACGGSSSESWAGVSADGDANIIYVSYDKHVAAINAETGESLWKYESDGAKFFAVPTVTDDMIYVGDYEGQLHALTLGGEEAWVYTPDRHTLIGPLALEPKDRIIGSVAVGDDYLYFGLGSRNVVAVSRETADEVWTFETDHGVWATPLYLEADSDLGRDVDTVYVASLDRNLYALDAATGDELWKLDLGGAVPGNIVYDEARNRVYAGTFVSELVAVDLEAQDIVARFETEDWLWGAPAFEDDVLYFGDLSGNLYAVRVTDDGFEQVWDGPQNVADDAIRSTPLLTDELIIVSSKDKNVYAVNKETGVNRWSEGAGAEALTNLVFVADAPLADDTTANLVVVGTDDSDNLLVAYNIESGEKSWRYKN